MKPRLEKKDSVPQLVQRRGFYLDILNYAKTDSVSLDAETALRFLEAYSRLKSALGHASYTEVARALDRQPLEVMQHVKYMHIQSKEYEVRFSNNRYNENVFFKLIPRSKTI